MTYDHKVIPKGKNPSGSSRSMGRATLRLYRSRYEQNEREIEGKLGNPTQYDPVGAQESETDMDGAGGGWDRDAQEYVGRDSLYTRDLTSADYLS